MKNEERRMKNEGKGRKIRERVIPPGAKAPGFREEEAPLANGDNGGQGAAPLANGDNGGQGAAPLANGDNGGQGAAPLANGDNGGGLFPSGLDASSPGDGLSAKTKSFQAGGESWITGSKTSRLWTVSTGFPCQDVTAIHQVEMGIWKGLLRVPRQGLQEFLGHLSQLFILTGLKL